MADQVERNRRAKLFTTWRNHCAPKWSKLSAAAEAAAVRSAQEHFSITTKHLRKASVAHRHYWHFHLWLRISNSNKCLFKRPTNSFVAQISRKFCVPSRASTCKWKSNSLWYISTVLCTWTHYVLDFLITIPVLMFYKLWRLQAKYLQLLFVFDKISTKSGVFEQKSGMFTVLFKRVVQVLWLRVLGWQINIYFLLF